VSGCAQPPAPRPTPPDGMGPWMTGGPPQATLRRVTSIELDGVTLSRGGQRLLDDVHLRIHSGERVVLLGPSGADKTTLLRVVAGLEEPTAGRVGLDGRDVTALPPRARDIAMVTQEASLQPHLDVAANVGFPLQVHGVDRDEIAERVAAEARVFSLQGLLHRRPRTLSAGQSHDVALARSLVRRGSVLLLDEPLARVDAARRETLLRDLIDVQEGYGVTLLAATNDQRVAMSLAHRLAILHAGRLAQVGTPDEVYHRPATSFVAGFLGSPPMNLLPGRVQAAVSGVRVQAGPLRLRSFHPVVTDLAGQAVVVGVRPSDLRLAGDDDVAAVEEPVVRTAFLGAEVEVAVSAGDGHELVALVPRPIPTVGALLRLALAPADVHLFAPDGPALAHGV
jgi:multiple sugar transport system ATP-binding protein